MTYLMKTILQFILIFIEVIDILILKNKFSN